MDHCFYKVTLDELQEGRRRRSLSDALEAAAEHRGRQAALEGASDHFAERVVDLVTEHPWLDIDHEAHLTPRKTPWIDCRYLPPGEVASFRLQVMAVVGGDTRFIEWLASGQAGLGLVYICE